MEIDDVLMLLEKGPVLTQEAFAYLVKAGFIETAANGSSNAWLSEKGYEAHVQSLFGPLPWPDKPLRPDLEGADQ